MATQFPIIVQKLVDLAAPPFDLPEKSFRYGHLAIESDQYVCVKSPAEDGTNQLVVVDLYHNNAITRQPTKKAEAALMHTRENIIVLRAKYEATGGHFIQIFNLDTKTRLLEQQFPEEVIYWKWASDSILAVVTTKSVWHCYLDANTSPAKIFDRGGKLADQDVQIINYSVDPTAKWCCLAGISSQDKKTVDGSLQLYSIERNQQQLLNGHAGCFGTLMIDEISSPLGVFAFAEKKEEQFMIHVMYIYSTKGDAPATSFKVTGQLNFPSNALLDFPIFMHLSEKHGVLYLVTRGGHIVLMDPLHAAVLFIHKVSNDTVFVSCSDTRQGGVIFANRKGVIYSAKVHEDFLISYIQQNLRHLPNCQDIALSLVRRYGYPGADDILIQSFNNAFARGDYKAAARTAALLKSGALRTATTINKFKAAPAEQGQTSPILQYFCTLLEHGKLNSLESMELVRPVVTQGRKEFVEKWLAEDKLECTEELGDLVKPMDGTLALKIYEMGDVCSKVLQSYVELGHYDKIIHFANKTKHQADYSLYLRSITTASPEGAVRLAKDLLSNTPPLIDIYQIIEVFTQQGRLQEITSILLDYLKGNKPEHNALQTKLFELNLTHAPQVAEAIFQMNTFTHYDSLRIGKLCEKAGLYQRALEHYTDNADIKRILSLHTGTQINSDWLVSYFGKLPSDICLECLSDMLKTNRQNLQVVVQAAVKYHEQIGTMRLVEMFEIYGSWEGIFYFLGSVIAFNTDPQVHFKYIEAASKLNHVQEVERVCRESQHYDPVQVKDFLKQAKLLDPRPLIYVCDRHGYVSELAEYLYKNSLLKFIEVYVVKVNPQQTPTVIGILLDLDCSEDFIKALLQSVRNACPIKELVEEVEKRNRLRLLLPWLEARVSEGIQDAELHNALGKIYIDTNRDPETFLKTNAFYNSKIVGKYCEERDPHLAYTAYKKAWGSCDEELLTLTNKNGLFRLQARYLVERQSPDLWKLALNPDNEWRQSVVDQVVASSLPESTSAEEVSTTVRAFMAANLPNELMELLEKIVLHNSDFSKNKNLQNLLILTAVKSDASRVMDYINRVDNYDGPEIAQVALGDDYKLYEECVLIYRKCGMDNEAMDVIINKIGGLDRAAEFAARCDKPSVWFKLAEAQLKQGFVKEAIEGFLKSENSSCFKEVIQKAEEAECYAELITYLLMARKTLPNKDTAVDSELVYAFARCGKLAEMEDFVLGSNTANVQSVGERLFENKDYEAAKTLFASIPNYSKLASCHLKLREYSLAVEAAKRAGSPKTWKEVNISCVQAEEFISAHIAGLEIISHPDHLEELIINYERSGHFEELILLLEAGVHSERAPIALFSELGIVYAKYKPQKLSDFIRSSNIASGRLNIPKLIRACERHLLWSECVFLHILYQQYDQAANTMIQHTSSWTHIDFLSVIQKVANSELYYKAIVFYLETSPNDLNALLIAISSKIDHSRVVQQVKKLGHLLLLQPYLEHIQQQQLDIASVNTALNDIYVQSEDYDSLRRSILNNPNFDQLGLASELENHPLTEFRRISCLLYRKSRQFLKAIELSKLDENFHDAMEAARASDNPDIAEDLLRYFVFEKKDKECFAACLYVCYHLVRPDIVLELAWRSKCTEQIMPYIIQTFREYSTRLEALEKKAGFRDQDGGEKSAPNDYMSDYMIPMSSMLTPGMGNLALMPPPGIGQPNGINGYNMSIDGNTAYGLKPATNMFML